MEDFDLALEKIKNAKEQQLNRLDLSKLKLYEIPWQIFELTQLKYLDLSGNLIGSVPAEILELENLYYLDLGGNRINDLPENFARLTYLKELNLSMNGLQVIPDEIFELPNLKGLELNINGIKSLPKSIEKAESLEKLAVFSNLINVLPEEISCLKRLRHLDLSSNPIVSLPSSIKRLENLEDLRLGKTKIVFPPQEILEINDYGYANVKNIKNFFNQIEEVGEDKFFEAKLIIIGEGGAGKTTLAKKIIDEDYFLTGGEETTEGIDVLKWNFLYEYGKNFQVNIWDFGGQEIYHTTHQFFLTKRSLYILVADTRKEDTDFYYWLNIVELLSDNSPLLIVKNEKQDRHRQINERSLRSNFASLKEVISSNLATNRGLDEIKKTAKFYITGLPHVGDPLPQTWVNVRIILENDERNYITQNEFINICKNNGIEKLEHSLLLSSYFHDLGVFLHFQNDPILKNIVILKPEWGTAAVYNVLDNKDVIKNLGKFAKDDLSEIWGAEYQGVYEELLQLMMRFQICYEIPNLRNIYIAPQLMTENQPQYYWDEGSTLHLRFQYDFMPKGILTRFIVVMNKWIKDQDLVWKSGIILKKEETHAEIIEFYNNREIRIRITGEAKKDLLAIISYEIEKIHDSFARLNFSKLIPCNCDMCLSRNEPHFYRFESLKKRIMANKTSVECDVSYDNVNVMELMGEVGAVNQLLRDGYVLPSQSISDALMEGFSADELEILCHQLGIDYDDIPGKTRRNKAIEIVKYCERRGTLDKLQYWAIEGRTN